jgi:hypothetical protein
MLPVKIVPISTGNDANTIGERNPMALMERISDVASTYGKITKTEAAIFDRANVSDGSSIKSLYSMSVTLDELKRSVTSNESGDLFDIGNSSYSPSVVSHVRCDGDDYGGIVE